MLLKRNLIYVLPVTIMLALWSQFAFGHGHSHEPVNKETANLKATKIIASFIKQKLLIRAGQVQLLAHQRKIV